MSTPTPPPIWTRPEPGERKPRFTRQQIARTAMAIADAEGYDAISMRRVAAELGSGTMTLYHYVANKNELLELLSDEIMAELLIPDGEMPDNWRDAFAMIARLTRAAFQRHGWMSTQVAEGTTIGPNGMRHFEQSLAAASMTGLPPEYQVELVNNVDEWVFGYILGDSGDGQFDPDELHPELYEYMDAQLATGEYPHVAALATGKTGPGTSREIFEWFVELLADEQRFERGLTRLLDGIALDVERRGGRT